MYSKEEVGLFFLALDEGMKVSNATDFAGVNRKAAGNWAAGRLPPATPGNRVECRQRRNLAGRRSPCRRRGSTTRRRAGRLPGSAPTSISNRSKCELGERLRRETGLPLRSITGFLRISKSSYEYHRARLADRADRDAGIRGLVKGLFAAESGSRGYRAVHARMRRASVVTSVKRVRRVMRKVGLRPVLHQAPPQGLQLVCRRGLDGPAQPGQAGFPCQGTR